jgi:hypothetical protein
LILRTAAKRTGVIYPCDTRLVVGAVRLIRVYPYSFFELFGTILNNRKIKGLAARDATHAAYYPQILAYLRNLTEVTL